MVLGGLLSLFMKGFDLIPGFRSLLLQFVDKWSYIVFIKVIFVQEGPKYIRFEKELCAWCCFYSRL